MASADWLANVCSSSHVSSGKSPGAQPPHDEDADDADPRGASARPPSTASRRRRAPADGRPGPGQPCRRPAAAAPPARRGRRTCRASEISALRSRSSTSSLVPYAVRTKKCCSASSNSINEPPSVPDSWTACMTIVDSTVSRSRLELTASPSWPSASSCSTLWASSALRASRARTRSRLRTAIAAAAANAVSSVMARSSNGSTSVRQTDSTPTTSSSSSIGAPMIVRIARDPLGVLAPVVGVGEHVVDLDRAPLETDPAVRASRRRGGTGDPSCARRSPSDSPEERARR